MRRTTNVLLASAVLLLAVDVAINVTGQDAHAQPQPVGGGNPYIVKLLPVSHLTYHRVWSDGRADQMQRPDGNNCDYESTLTHGPVEHPVPVVDAVFGFYHNDQSVMLTFEDGRVDLIAHGERCTIAGVGTPSLCPADIDRDGEIGIEDFLMVLGAWGVCE